MISVVIPVFNKEHQIEKCLRSIMHQSYKNYEVIIINDGSTDKSEMAIKKFVSSFSNIKYIYQKNQGVSAARNAGIKVAKGKYIIFVDADDYIESDYFETLIKFKHYDLVISGYTEVYNNFSKKYIPIEKSINKNEYHKMLFNNQNFRYMIVPYLKLYKTKIIKENNLLFYQDLSYGEDAIFVSEYVKQCANIKFINYNGYKNMIFSNTLSHKYIDNLYDKNVFICEKLIVNYGIQKNKKALSFVVMNYMQNVIYNEVKNKRYLELRNVFHQINRYLSIKKIHFFDCNESKQKLIFILLKLRLYFIIKFLYILK